MRKKMNLLSMSKNELKNVKGAAATWCGCGCLYAGEKEDADDDYYGGSSTSANGSANAAEGLHSVMG